MDQIKLKYEKSIKLIKPDYAFMAWLKIKVSNLSLKIKHRESYKRIKLDSMVNIAKILTINVGTKADILARKVALLLIILYTF